MSVSVSMEEFGDRLRKLGPAMHAAIRKGMVEGAMRLQAQTQVEIDTSIPHKPVDVGTYAAAFQVKRTPDGAIFFNPTKQAAWIEIGRRAGPVSEEGFQHLVDWVRRKKLYLDVLPGVMQSMRADRPGPLGKEGRAKLKTDAVTEACKHVAFAIRKKLTAEGYAPRFPVARAIKHSVGPIRKILRDSIKQVKP